MIKLAIITGINGQDGAYLSELLLDKGYEILGILRNEASDLSKLEYLGIKDKIKYEICDLEDSVAVGTLIQQCKPNEIYNLAAISSVGYSFNQPSETISFNVISVLNILESIRLFSPNSKFYQASSSEMFGKVRYLPIKGDENYHPLSPYAVSKVSGHLMTKNYREAFNIFACTGILFNHESYLRSDNFFIKKVIKESIKISKGEQEYLKVGNIDIKRDFGFAKKYVEAMYLMMQKDRPNDYIVCSGKSTKLRDIIEYVFAKLNISIDKLIVDKDLYRPLELVDIYGDNSKVKNELRWDYELDFYDVIDIIINEEIVNKKNQV